VWPLTLSVAAAAPYSTLEALISTARLSLWVFTLDDLFDEERVPRSELMRRVERYRAIAQGIPQGETGSGTRDTLAAALREIRDDLAGYPLFASLGQVWVDALCGTIDSMLDEYQWRLRRRQSGNDMQLPSYEQYVECGLSSIGGPPHVWAELITTDDPSTPEHIEQLRVMERIASTCIRLANDLQSYQKEVSEGKFNSLVILSRGLLESEPGLSEAEAYARAEARVRAEIAAGIDRLAALERSAGTRTGRPEAAIANIARFVCDFYSQHDYHTFLAQAS
jgi:hypothetical protein